ncbi:MAG: ATP-dependent sacrificial sulfur transferase LarE [Peptococcaceae bacterium]|nr:ATP-dependent sacrificial sulfur transferase LarE [Candidatus Syntrophopropionicum ammoniitolerans]
MGELERKLGRLENIIKGYGSVLVAFSGGVDSTLLLKVAQDILANQVLAVTAVSAVNPPGEVDEAGKLAEAIGAGHVIINTGDLESMAFKGNPPDRCYICKKEIYTALLKLAEERGIRQVIDGVNADDGAFHRPGLRAGEELGVLSPLQEAGLTKQEIYILSRRFALPTAHKPASPCLATRFPYGVEITPRGLAMVYQAEEYLKSLGIDQVRVRHHGDLARIEISPACFELLMTGSREVVARLKEIGYTYTALDLQGFRSGSMDEAGGAGSL